MKETPPSIQEFEQRYPGVWKAFQQLADQCHEAGGPLTERERRLVKLALAIGAQHEGAVHSAVRHAMASGISRDEMMHAAILAVTTIGWPAAGAAMSWINDLNP